MKLTTPPGQRRYKMAKPNDAGHNKIRRMLQEKNIASQHLNDRNRCRQRRSTPGGGALHYGIPKVKERTPRWHTQRIPENKIKGKNDRVVARAIEANSKETRKLAMPKDHCWETSLDVEINGNLYKAHVTDKPLYDANGGKMKS